MDSYIITQNLYNPNYSNVLGSFQNSAQPGMNTSYAYYDP